MGAVPNPKAALFSTWLSGQMIHRRLSKRALGKLIDPENPERGRRQVLRHLGVGGPLHFPNKRTRRVYLDVFELEGDPFTDDEDEDQPMARDLKSLARRQREMQQQLAEVLKAVRA